MCPTRFRDYDFSAEHTLGYIAIFYMIFVHNFRPNFRSMNRSYIALWVMAAIAYSVNTMIPGANYLYMARPEAAPSVLDILPPHFGLRFAIMVFAITVMFCLAYLPWYLKDKKKARKNRLPDRQAVCLISSRNRGSSWRGWDGAACGWPCSRSGGYAHG